MHSILSFCGEFRVSRSPLLADENKYWPGIPEAQNLNLWDLKSLSSRSCKSLLQSQYFCCWVISVRKQAIPRRNSQWVFRNSSTILCKNVMPCIHYQIMCSRGQIGVERCSLRCLFSLHDQARWESVVLFEDNYSQYGVVGGGLRGREEFSTNFLGKRQVTWD